MYCTRTVFCVLLLLLIENDASSPLSVTPYLDKGDAATARSLARITPDIGNVTSYSGYFSINTTCQGHLFFWFFPAQTDWEDAPVVMWVEGGPGSSSMFSLFDMIGPFHVLDDGVNIESRNYSWANISNLLFIDNPIGSGFSYSDTGCFATDMPEVGDGLYSAVSQFFKMFSELQGNDFWLIGESFAGHYIPFLGNLIHQRKATSEININLKGVVMGNPMTKLDCHDYASYLYNVAIIDDNLRDEMYVVQNQLKEYVRIKNYTAAWTLWNNVILDEMVRIRSGIDNVYTILTVPEDARGYLTFFNSSSVREQIHVGDTEFFDVNLAAYYSLFELIAVPYEDKVEELLNTGEYVVGFFSGQLDIICLYTSTVCIMRGLEWSGRQEYLNATRHIWTVDGGMAGWFKTADNRFLDIVIKDAGHNVAYFKPAPAYAMVKSIITAKHGEDPLWELDIKSQV